ncbi:MAG: tetratricopeptide repeat protein [Candidatus Kapaibacteriales bacterium]
MKTTKLILLFIFLIHYPHFSQSILKEKFRLAQSFEKSGDFQSAEKIYLELYNSNKRNKDYFDALTRTLKAQNKHSELLPIIREQIQFQNGSELQILLAETLWQLGMPNDAKIAWEKAKELKPNDENTYLSIAISQSSFKQFELATETLAQAKKLFPKSPHIPEELIKLHLVTANFNSAIEEIFNQFDLTQNLNSTQAKLGLLLFQKELIEKIEKKILVHRNFNQRNYKLLAIWFYRSTKDYLKAFEIVKELDVLQKSNGYEVLYFANNSLADGQYDIAIRGFEYVISLGKKSPYYINAVYGIAKANDAKIIEQGNLEPSALLNLIDQYKKILRDFPDNQISYEIKYRIAVLYFKYLHEFDNAQEYLQSLLKAKNNPFSTKAQILLADISLFQNKYDEALKKYQLVIESTSSAKNDDYFVALNQLAKAFYYKTEFDSAQFYFTKLLEEAPPELTTSALRKSLFIEQNKQYTFSLKNIALAEMKLEQNQIDSALLFLNIAKTKTEGTELGEYIDLELAKLYFQIKDYPKGLYLLKNFKQNQQESIYIEEALFYLGLINQALHEQNEAVATFTELLTKYPRSIYSTKARYLLNSWQKK